MVAYAHDRDVAFVPIPFIKGPGVRPALPRRHFPRPYFVFMRGLDRTSIPRFHLWTLIMDCRVLHGNDDLEAQCPPLSSTPMARSSTCMRPSRVTALRQDPMPTASRQS